MSTLNTEREERLPKWAQTELRRLRMQLAKMHETASKRANKQPTRVTVAGGFGNPALFNAPDYASVTFELPSKKSQRRRWIDVRLAERGGEVLEIMGSDPISVRPRASNVVFIEVEE